mmetsp:Transcript_26629/g.48591  ORF Transcript_26629/g.48591 Transcript_26629/m.48591 type:complete len:387 (-) Transcript_26629:136-1296(-)
MEPLILVRLSVHDFNLGQKPNTDTSPFTAVFGMLSSSRFGVDANAATSPLSAPLNTFKLTKSGQPANTSTLPVMGRRLRPPPRLMRLILGQFENTDTSPTSAVTPRRASSKQGQPESTEMDPLTPLLPSRTRETRKELKRGANSAMSSFNSKSSFLPASSIFTPRSSIDTAMASAVLGRPTTNWTFSSPHSASGLSTLQPRLWVLFMQVSLRSSSNTAEGIELTAAFVSALEAVEAATTAAFVVVSEARFISFAFDGPPTSPSLAPVSSARVLSLTTSAFSGTLEVSREPMPGSPCGADSRIVSILTPPSSSDFSFFSTGPADNSSSLLVASGEIAASISFEPEEVFIVLVFWWRETTAVVSKTTNPPDAYHVHGFLVVNLQAAWS